eukprot:Opistho-2@30098
MSKGNKRAAANALDTVTESVNERIVRTVYELYTKDADEGLIRISSLVGKPLTAPRRKVNVVLIGNHSAGKSSFINWYVEDTVQRTGVAIETQGFTIVESGNKRDTLMGPATVHLFPIFQEISKVDGVLNHLQTAVCPSKQKMFPMVTFIDTPGLVDGAMIYPFDVDRCIFWLASQADLICVFLDPMGQALCARTMNIVEKINNEKWGDKMRFYLSKADTVPDEADRQKVLIQITQNLSTRLKNRTFDLPTIYLPSPDAPKQQRMTNQIEDLCKLIHEKVKDNVQETLKNLETDCEKLSRSIEQRLVDDTKARSDNIRATFRGIVLYSFAFGAPLLVVAWWLLAIAKDSVVRHVGDDVAGHLFSVHAIVDDLKNHAVPSTHRLEALLALLGFCFFVLLFAKFTWKTKPTLTGKEVRALNDRKKFLQTSVVQTQKTLYKEFTAQFFDNK